MGHTPHEHEWDWEEVTRDMLRMLAKASLTVPESAKGWHLQELSKMVIEVVDVWEEDKHYISGLERAIENLGGNVKAIQEMYRPSPAK